MQLEISPKTEERLRALVRRGVYPSLEAALDGVVAEAAQQEADYDAELTRKLDRARASAIAGRHERLTSDLANQIKREGRARFAGVKSPPR